MSCDNLQGNGDRTRQVVSWSCARRPDGESTRRRASRTRWWTGSRRRPPTTTATRSRSASGSTTPGRSSASRSRSGCWRTTFTLGRPPYEDAGVQVVERRRAVRADEAAAAQREPPGALLLRLPRRLPARPRGRPGPALPRPSCAATWTDEGTPTLAPVPGVDLDDYKATLIERFSNPEVRDTVARLCAESSDRIPKWLLPVVRHNLASDGEIERSAADRRQLGALRRRHRRAGRADRGRRPAQGPRQRANARERRVPRGPRAVRRPRPTTSASSRPTTRR